MATLEKKRRIIAILLVSVAALSLIRTFGLIWNSNLLDFSLLYYAAQSTFFLENPYTNTLLFTPVTYPPVTFIFFLPFILFSFQTAANLWLTLSVVASLISIWLAYRIMPSQKVTYALIFFTMVIAFPFKFSLGMGQVNIVLLLFILLFIFFYQKGRFLLSAVSLSIAISLKLFPVVFLLYFLIIRNFKYFFLTLGITLTFFVLSYLYFGHYIYQFYFEEIVQGILLQPGDGVYYNQSLTAFLHRFSLPSVMLVISRLLAFSACIFAIYKSKGDFLFSISLILTTVLLVNSFTWQHHLILLLIPFTFLVTKPSTTTSKLVLLVAYILIAINIRQPMLFAPSNVTSLFLSHGFIGTLILWVLMLSKSKKFK